MCYLHVSLQKPLQHPEQSQQPQQAGLSPWPNYSEPGMKPPLSPIQSPLAAQVPTLGTQAVSTPLPSQLPSQAGGPSWSSQQHLPHKAPILTHHHGYAAMATEFLERVKEDLYIEDIYTSKAVTAELQRENAQVALLGREDTC